MSEDVIFKTIQKTLEDLGEVALVDYSTVESPLLKEKGNQLYSCLLNKLPILLILEISFKISTNSSLKLIVFRVYLVEHCSLCLYYIHGFKCR